MLERLLPQGTTVLDVGCNVGDSLRWASEHGYQALRGIDINETAVLSARTKLADLPDVRIEHGSADALPFADASVDLVLCLEVFEHIPADIRAAAAKEMRRVLKPGGRLLLTTPHAGLFDWMDPENLRFRFPALHRWLGGRIGGAGKEAGYAGQKHGVVEHHHFTMDELAVLLAPHFVFRDVIGRGVLLFPLGAALHWPFYRRQATAHWLFRATQKVMALDYAIRVPLPLAYNVVLAADPRC